MQDLVKKIELKAADGYLLSGILASPIKASQKVVILSGGTGIKKEFYLNFALYLTEHDYHVLLFDYRGIGESAPKDLKESQAYIHDWGLMDMNAALEFVLNHMHLTNVIWVGHSIGAQMVGFLEKQNHIQKIVSVCAGTGYWKEFSFPSKISVWILWFIASPILVKLFGYAPLKKIGWGADLPKNVILEWRKWCTNKDYYKMFIQEHFQTDKFYDFKIPITAIYISDDAITNDKTASSLLSFYPNSQIQKVNVNVKEYTGEKVGHIGIFRKKFEKKLWPIVLGHLL